MQVTAFNLADHRGFTKVRHETLDFRFSSLGFGCNRHVFA
jgi:hypothetical protein